MSANTRSLLLVAEAFATIHRELSTLTPEVRNLLNVAMGNQTLDLDQKMGFLAASTESLLKLPEVNERQREAYIEDQIDMYSDMRTKEYIDELLPQTELGWQYALQEHRQMMVDMEEDEALSAWDALAEEQNVET